MALQEGTKGFQLRGEGFGVSATYPYWRGDAATKTFYSGTPVIVSSGDTVDRAVTVSGLITSPKLLGWVSNPDHDPAIGAEFAQLPYITNIYARRLVRLYRAFGVNEYSAAVRSGIQVTGALIGVKCTFFEETADQFVIDTNATQYPLITITGYRPNDLNKFGGIVDFRIPGANSQFETP